ncbi:cobalamin biosynthesis protein CbiD [Planctomycetaceae bacterium SCGC AG-212-F19]|nr:cobalamin biosynthesis protein CbiD [Planctomycetaceae bacterium SCGC AG-212-F19]
MMPRPPHKIVRGHTVPPRNPQGRREGFTTGVAAAAAAKAASLILLEQEWPETVAIQLPVPRLLTIRINTMEYENETARCGVVKDAGDDPDVTHGAEIFASVRRVGEPGIHIQGGVGVGVVTRPGLELPVGSPAINPVPLKMIRQAVEEALLIANLQTEANPGVEVTISVPNGEELARRTFNGRLGIVGGISILGTTGIVKAMSTAAWRASVLQAIDVAAANSVMHIVLSTGGRTEKFAQKLYPELPEIAFVEMGIFTGASLQRAAERRVPRVALCCMIGKLSKIAAGRMQTHVAGNQVDCGLLAELARELGAPDELVGHISAANSARHVQELVQAAGFARFYPALCERAARQCAAVVAGKCAVDVTLFDFDGNQLGKATA